MSLSPTPDRGKNRTPLMVAARQGCLADLVELTRAETSCLNDTDDRGGTALFHAVSASHVECVEALLAAGADTSLAGHVDLSDPETPDDYRSSEFPDDDFFPPLIVAAHGSLARCPGSTEILELLIRYGADPNQRSEGDSHTSALAVAAEANRVDVLDFLLDNGADANNYEERHRAPTPLCAGLSSLSSLTIAKKLLGRGADVNGHTWWSGNSTPLHVAARTASRAGLRLLLDHGADHTAKTRDGLTALDGIMQEMWGVSSKSEEPGFFIPICESIRLLASLPNARLHTALWLAICSGQHQLGMVLVTCGADLHAKVQADTLVSSMIQIGQTALDISRRRLPSARTNEQFTFELQDQESLDWYIDYSRAARARRMVEIIAARCARIENRSSPTHDTARMAAQLGDFIVFPSEIIAMIATCVFYPETEVLLTDLPEEGMIRPEFGLKASPRHIMWDTSHPENRPWTPQYWTSEDDY